VDFYLASTGKSVHISYQVMISAYVSTLLQNPDMHAVLKFIGLSTSRTKNYGDKRNSICYYCRELTLERRLIRESRNKHIVISAPVKLEADDNHPSGSGVYISYE
jgi:hypothetical protein